MADPTAFTDVFPERITLRVASWAWKQVVASKPHPGDDLALRAFHRSGGPGIR